MKTIIALLLTTTAAWASPAGECRNLEDTKSTMLSGMKWIDLSHDQWEFVRGISVLNPETPRGIPVGDGAALVKLQDGSGIIFFIDGGKVCQPMKLPKEGIEMVEGIATGVIKHSGEPL